MACLNVATQPPTWLLGGQVGRIKSSSWTLSISIFSSDSILFLARRCGSRAHHFGTDWNFSTTIGWSHIYDHEAFSLHCFPTRHRFAISFINGPVLIYLCLLEVFYRHGGNRGSCLFTVFCMVFLLIYFRITAAYKTFFRTWSLCHNSHWEQLMLKTHLAEIGLCNFWLN